MYSDKYNNPEHQLFKSGVQAQPPPCDPLQGGNNPALRRRRGSVRAHSDLHTFFTYSHLPPFPLHVLLPLPVCHKYSRLTGSVSQRVHLLNIVSHYVFLSLEAVNGRAAEWISSGNDDSMLASIFVLLSSPAPFSIHPFSSLCPSASARGHRLVPGHTHTKFSQHPLK